MTALQIAEALNGYKTNNGWMACCPAHSDENPSLSISEKNGKILVHCFTGCSQSEVIAALRSRNLWPFRARTTYTHSPNTAMEGPSSVETFAKPEIICAGQDGEVIKKIWEVIDFCNNNSPKFFLRDSRLVELRDRDGLKYLHLINEKEFMAELAHIASWKKIAKVPEKDGGGTKKVDTHVPQNIVSMAFQKPSLNIPHLNTVFHTPFFNKTGNIIIENGYHENEKAYLNLQANMDFIPNVIATAKQRSSAGILPPSWLGVNEVQFAKDLFTSLLHDFDFAEESDKANYLGLLLEPLARQIIGDATPLYMIDASSKGSGKTLLAEIASLITRGIYPSGVSFPSNEEERKKIITSQFIEGTDQIFFDNVTGTVDSAHLAYSLTARTYKDRILGVSKTVEFPNNVSWIMTGNNLSTTTEIGRRAVPIRLSPRVSEPWKRSPNSFMHPDIKGWVKNNRELILYALLILIQNWVDQGMPRNSRSLASFESWSRVIGGILESAGINGFLANHSERMASGDDERDSVDEILEIWWNTRGDVIVRPSNLCGYSNLRNAFLTKFGKDLKDQALVSMVGKFLYQNRDTIFGQFQIKLITDGGVRRGRTYKLLRTPSPAPNPLLDQQLNLSGRGHGEVSLDEE